MEPHPPLVFALQATRPLGERLAAALGTSLAAHEERTFEDGEHKTRPLENVRDRDVYVLHALHASPWESPNDKLCRLLFFAGALRDAGAARVTVLAPYLCYARKERRTKPRDPVTTRYVAAMVEAVGVDRLVTLDVHDLAGFQNAFRCRTEHLEAKLLFVRHLAPRLVEGEVAVLSPDAGGFKRAESFRQALAERIASEPTIAFLEKLRSGGVLSGERLIGDVEGRAVVVVDDIVATGDTLLRAARACRRAGAVAVWAVATHGLFPLGCEHLLSAPELDGLAVTDSVTPPDAASGRLAVVGCAPLLAEAVRRLASGGSLVELAAEGPPTVGPATADRSEPSAG